MRIFSSHQQLFWVSLTSISCLSVLNRFQSPLFKFNHFSLLLTVWKQSWRGPIQRQSTPTYVYPECLKAAIRERLSGDLRDYPNPETSAVGVLHYHAYYCYCYCCYKYSRTPLSPIFPASRDSGFVVVLHLNYITSLTSRLC